MADTRIYIPITEVSKRAAKIKNALVPNNWIKTPLNVNVTMPEIALLVINSKSK